MHHELFRKEFGEFFIQFRIICNFSDSFGSLPFPYCILRMVTYVKVTYESSLEKCSVNVRMSKPVI